MTRRNLWNLFAFLLLALTLTIVACDNGEETYDGDNTDGDQPSNTLGIACVNGQEDCAEGTTCMPVPGSGRICTVTCTSSAECQSSLGAGSCCSRIGTTFYCIPAIGCTDDTDGDIGDGDTGDGDTGDGDIPTDGDNSCEPDSYRCKDTRTLERCSNEGAWQTYKSCSPGTNCYNGACVDGAPQCDGSTFCCPDTYRCYEKDIQKCRADGSDWDFYRTCEGTDLCIDGKCESIEPTDGDTTDGDATDGDSDGDEDPGVACTMEDGCESDIEYCFNEHADAEEGVCRIFCDQPGGNCPRGYRCQSGMCTRVPGYCVSDGQCELEEFCDKRPGSEDGLCVAYCFNMGEFCPLHSYCDENPGSLNYGKCVYESCTSCTFDQQCAGGQYCDIAIGQVEGCCMEMCGPNNPCPGAMECLSDGRCGIGDGMGDCGGSCPGGYVCDPLYNQCALNCPACPAQKCCDQASAPNCYVCECSNPIVCGWGLKQCCMGYSCSAIVYGVLGFCI